MSTGPSPLPADPWHYARTRLAHEALTAFDPGPSSSLVIFERRRMGKTEFLLRDFTPWAESRGWNVLYMSFLGESDPFGVFLRRLEEFGQGAAGRFADGVTGAVAGFVARLPIKKAGAGGMSVELGDPGRKQDAMRTLFAAALKRHEKIILIMDEIQVLAVGGRGHIERNRAFLETLRTCLDENKVRVRAVFNGSSQNGLRHMFGDYGQAFYRYATVFPFPEMGREFTDFLVSRLAAATGRSVDADVVEAFFNGPAAKSPALARQLMSHLVQSPSLSLEDAIRLVMSTERADVASVWAGLTVLQREILFYLCKGGSAPYSKKALAALTARIGIPLTTSSVQTAVKAMTSGKNATGEILSKDPSGEVVFQDPAFRRFVEGELPVG